MVRHYKRHTSPWGAYVRERTMAQRIMAHMYESFAIYVPFRSTEIEKGVIG